MGCLINSYDNIHLQECGGLRGSKIVLVAKPRQEKIVNIIDFIWRMCVSFRSLNKVTKLYEYSTSRCDMVIIIFQIGSAKMWAIIVDAKQSYHQVAVRDRDMEKLDLFTPNHKKYAFKVMPFGPVNSPVFYTFMIGILKEEWNA